MVVASESPHNFSSLQGADQTPATEIVINVIRGKEKKWPWNYLGVRSACSKQSPLIVQRREACISAPTSPIPSEVCFRKTETQIQIRAQISGKGVKIFNGKESLNQAPPIALVIAPFMLNGFPRQDWETEKAQMQQPGSGSPP